MKLKKKPDLLTGPLWNKILLFALPLAASGILQQLFNAADIAIVGRFTGDLGERCMGAVGSNGPVVSLVVNVFTGLSLGANVVISRAVGMEDKNTISRAVHSSIILAIISGFIVMLIGEAFAKPLLTALKVPSDVLPLAVLYLRVYLLGLPAILLYNFEAAIFRSVGDTKTPLIVLAVCGVINVLLNLFFVIVLKITVAGVAIATAVSNLIGAGILLVLLMRSNLEIRVYLNKLKIDKGVLIKVLKLGVPAGLQSGVFCVANMVVQSAINELGTIVLAASSAAYNIECISHYSLISYGQACTTFVGQNSGAGKIDRCKRTLTMCIIEGVTSLGVFASIFLPFGKNLLSLFNTNPEVINIGYIRILYIVGYAYVFYLLYDVIGSYLRGYGYSLIPAVISMVGVCGVRIAWIYTAFPKNPSFETVMTVYPISLFTTAVLMTTALIIIRPAKRILKRGK